MKRNSVDGMDYVFETITSASVTYILYWSFLFKAVPKLCQSDSARLLHAMIIVGTLAGILMTYEWNRNTFSSLVVSMIPYGVYTYLAYRKSFRTFFNVLLVLAFLLAAVYLIYIVKARSRCLNPKRVKRLKFQKSYIVLSTILTLTSCVMVLTVTASVFVFNKSNSFSPDCYACDEEYTIASNIDTVCKLEADTWKDLNVKEKMEVLQCICLIEGNYLGLHDKVSVKLDKLDDNVNAEYSSEKNMVIISEAIMARNDSEEILKSVCHEMFHAAQWQYVKIYDSIPEEQKKCFFMYDAAVYKSEFENYKNGADGDIDSYYLQKCEKDARAYAESAVEDYFEIIRKHNNGGNENAS